MTDSNVNEDRYSDRTSSSLLERAKQQDPDAWERIVELYSPMVFRWCTASGLSADAALDIGQEVWITAFRKLGDFAPRHEVGSFRAWLRAITKSRFVDYLRRTPEIGVGGESDRFQQVAFQEDSDESVNEDQSLLYRQIEKHIRDHFSQKHCDAFFRVTLKEEEPAEVALSLGMTRNAVYLACVRIRKRIRDDFGDLLAGAGPDSG